MKSQRIFDAIPLGDGKFDVSTDHPVARYGMGGGAVASVDTGAEYMAQKTVVDRLKVNLLQAIPAKSSTNFYVSS